MERHNSNSSDEDSDDVLDISGTSESAKLLVVAIDFGTTFSGYAFSFKNKPGSIHMNRSWAQSLGFQSYKTPTSVLVGPDGEFKAFGYEAEQMYSELEEEEEVGGYELYRHFKMLLHKDGVSRRSKIKSISGVLCNAMDIFAMSLRYLKNHVLSTVDKYTTTSLEDDSIKWMITVPAIWTDEAKQFMREAACQAGIIDSNSSRQLSIALEPEAASVYCKTLDIEHFVCGENIKSVSFTPGTKYMVIDAGGGTVDITAYEVLVYGQLKELYAANGGPWGGTEVDNNFIQILKDILGNHFIKLYQKTCPKQWLTLMTNFENSKKHLKIGEGAKIVIPLSWSLGEKYREVMEGKNIGEAIAEASSSGVKFTNGSLVLGQSAIESLFKPVVDKIVQHLSGIMGEPRLEECQYFLLVGGFAECEFLQKAITESFSSVQVLVPAEAQMSVIKGAVLFGHNPSTIYSRIARKTYGYRHVSGFDEERHDVKYRFVAEGRDRCKGLFNVFVQQGDIVKTAKCIRERVTPVVSYQTAMAITLFTLDRKASQNQPEYTDTQGFAEVGKLHVDMPDLTGGKNRRVDVDISFGETEIFVSAKDCTSGNTANTSIDFLTD